MVCFNGTDHAPECVPPAGRVPDLASALVEQGHDVVVYVRRGASGSNSEPMMDGARVVPLPAGPPVELTEAETMSHTGAFAEQLRDALAGQRPDVVHSHGWLAGLATMLAGGQDHPPVAHTFHRRPRLVPRPRTKVGRSAVERYRAERAIARRADQLIASSPDEQLSLLRIGVPRARVSLVPPGVDCGELSPDGIQEPRDGRFRLVMFGGSDRADDGVATAVRALTALPDTELVITSDPTRSSWAPNEADWVRRLADRLQVSDRIRLQRGNDQGQRCALVRSADAILCLSAPRGQSAALLEAMACAEPVITSPEADLLDAVVDGVTGVHVSASDPKLLALAVRELLDNTALRQGMGFAGRDRAVHRYGWPHIAAETGRLYRQLVDRPATTRTVPAVATT
jgi:D-inositol-3-phosphate glycosyltransferase